MCRRYLGPHLYSDGDGTICNACVKKSTERGGSSVYKGLRDTLKQHLIDGGDYQSFEFFIHSNDAEDVTYLHCELVFIFTLQESDT